MPLSPRDRQLRVLVLEALERQAKQFRGTHDIWPFRVPHEPLDATRVIDATLLDAPGRLSPEDLRSRSVLIMEWTDGHRWEAWALTLPSGLHLYFDSDATETRLLASAKRGNPLEADRFFLELVAESRGHVFGIEMGGALPNRVRTPIDDRAFLCDVCVELFEGTDAELQIRAALASASGDFRHDVEQWLNDVLTAPAATRAAKRIPRLRELDQHS